MLGCFGGAVDQIRTGDLFLGKEALYQLSYYRTLPIPTLGEAEVGTPTSASLDVGAELLPLLSVARGSVSISDFFDKRCYGYLVVGDKPIY